MSRFLVVFGGIAYHMNTRNSTIATSKAARLLRIEADELDGQILSCLVDNARESARSLALRLKVSPATVVTRIKRLEKAGAIRGYSALLDYQQLGYDYIALTEVTAVKGRIFEAMQEISKLSGVVSIYEVTGQFDFMVLSRSRTRAEFSRLIHHFNTLENVSHTDTRVIFNIVREENRSYQSPREQLVGIPQERASK
jgi:DNA-binding Lrp family transcriptional regulator